MVGGWSYLTYALILVYLDLIIMSSKVFYNHLNQITGSPYRIIISDAHSLASSWRDTVFKHQGTYFLAFWWGISKIEAEWAI